MKLNKTEIHILAKKIYNKLEKENLELEKEFKKTTKEDVEKYIKEIKNVLPDYIFNEINDIYLRNGIENAIEDKFYKKKYNLSQYDVSDDIILKLANNSYSGNIDSLENDLLTKYQNDAE